MSKLEKIIGKLKDTGVFSGEDLENIQESIKEIINEKVELLSEEKVNELEEHAESYCTEKIEEGLKEAKVKLEEENEKYLTDLEDRLVENIDQFLDVQICENISDDALKTIAINETLHPLVEGIKELFESKYVPLDTEGDALLKDYKKKLEESEEKVSSLIAEKMELATLAETGASKLIIAEKTKDLTDSERERVETFFEGKTFDEIESKIDGFVDMVTEKEIISKGNEEEISESETTSESDCLEEEIIDVNDKDVEEISESERISDDAEYFL
jgi:hypothetical protein